MSGRQADRNYLSLPQQRTNHNTGRSLSRDPSYSQATPRYTSTPSTLHQYRTSTTSTSNGGYAVPVSSSSAMGYQDGSYVSGSSGTSSGYSSQAGVQPRVTPSTGGQVNRSNYVTPSSTTRAYQQPSTSTTSSSYTSQPAQNTQSRAYGSSTGLAALVSASEATEGIGRQRTSNNPSSQSYRSEAQPQSSNQYQATRTPNTTNGSTYSRNSASASRSPPYVTPIPAALRVGNQTNQGYQTQTGGTTQANRSVYAGGSRQAVSSLNNPVESSSSRPIVTATTSQQVYRAPATTTASTSTSRPKPTSTSSSMVSIASQPTPSYRQQQQQQQQSHPTPAATLATPIVEEYPIAPSPAYDPVAFERMIGLHGGENDIPETPRPYEVEGTAAATAAQANGGSSSTGNRGTDRLDALVRATDGQLAAWNQNGSGGSGAAAGTNGTEAVEDVPAAPAKPKRIRNSKKADGSTPKSRKKGQADQAAEFVDLEGDAAPMEGVEGEGDGEDRESTPFNSLTAHLAAYAQRDRALFRSADGYAKIPDMDAGRLLKLKQSEAAQQALQSKRETELRRQQEERRKQAEERRRIEVEEEAAEEASRRLNRSETRSTQPIAQPQGMRMFEHNDADDDDGVDELAGFGDVDVEVDEEADYETQRQMRIAHNKKIMAALGLNDDVFVGAAEDDREPRARGRPRTKERRPEGIKRQKKIREPRYSPDGTTVDPCPSEQRQRMAYVDMPNVFRSQRLQDSFKYEPLPAVPENPRPKPVAVELDEGMLLDSEDEGRRKKGKGKQPAVEKIKYPVVPYSELPTDTCHQCRRRSFKPKMACRNKDPVCNHKYCKSCIDIRYNFPFHELSRTFICPKCQGFCNCSSCLRANGWIKYLNIDENDTERFSLSMAALKSAPNVQTYLELLGAPKAPPQPKQEIHGIRFVHQEEDIVTPEIPEDVFSHLMAQHRKRKTQVKTMAKRGVGPKKVRAKKRKAPPEEEDVPAVGVEAGEGEAAGEASTSTRTRPKPKRVRRKKNTEPEEPPVDHSIDPTLAALPPPPAERPHPAVDSDGDSIDELDEESVAILRNQPYYDPQYGYQAGAQDGGDVSRHPGWTAAGAGEQNYTSPLTNAWSVYRS